MGGATDRKILRRAQRLPTICLPPIGQAAFLLCVLCALLWQFLPRSPSHICLPPEMLLYSFVFFLPSCGHCSPLCALCALLWQFLRKGFSTRLCSFYPLVAIALLFVPFVPFCGNSSAEVQEAAQGESEDARQILQSLRRALVVEDIFLDLEFVAAK